MAIFGVKNLKKMRKKRNNLFLIICVLVFSSCRVENPFYFDINTQTIYSCDKKVFYSINIDNDSIKPDGHLYEGGVILIWNDTISPPPSKINIDSIPDKYNIYRAGCISHKRFKLNPNSTYTLSKRGLGGVNYRIKIWTNFEGRVIKTSNPPQLPRDCILSSRAIVSRENAKNDGFGWLVAGLTHDEIMRGELRMQRI